MLVVLVVFAALANLYLMSLDWTTGHLSPAAVTILNTPLITGAVPIAGYASGMLAVVFLLARRARGCWIVTAVIGAVVGAGVAVGILALVATENTFGVQLSETTSAWVIAAFAAIGLSVSGFVASSGARRLGSAITVVLVIFAGFIGVNSAFGLNRTVGDTVGISTERTVALPEAKSTPAPVTPLDGGALWANWRPPAGMPASGTTAQVVIPNTISGFRARPAGLYLPPAALVAHPPPLPLVIMMMGQPGNPDPSFSAAVLNRFAARHDGLAPIVLVADQLGNPSVDPLCLDTKAHGNPQTYLVQDVVSWARTHLHVMPDAAHWTIAGYSNGGECALELGAKYPQIWGNVLDISGEKYAGEDRAARTLAVDFGGNLAAYKATWPLGILAAGHYPDTDAIFTVGSNDGIYRPEAIAVAAAARAAHWTTTFFEVPNGGHVLRALNGGLQEGYTILFPRLGLSNPTTTP